MFFSICCFLSNSLQCLLGTPRWENTLLFYWSDFSNTPRHIVLSQSYDYIYAGQTAKMVPCPVRSAQQSAWLICASCVNRKLMSEIGLKILPSNRKTLYGPCVPYVNKYNYIICNFGSIQGVFA